MNAGKQLRAIRESKGLTRKELSQKANISVSTLVKIELEENKPTSFTLYKLAQALEIGELELIKIFERK